MQIDLYNIYFYRLLYTGICRHIEHIVSKSTSNIMMQCNIQQRLTEKNKWKVSTFLNENSRIFYFEQLIIFNFINRYLSRKALCFVEGMFLVICIMQIHFVTPSFDVVYLYIFTFLNSEYYIISQIHAFVKFKILVKFKLQLLVLSVINAPAVWLYSLRIYAFFNLMPRAFHPHLTIWRIWFALHNINSKFYLNLWLKM